MMVLVNFDLVACNFDLSSMSVPMGTFEYDEDVRLTVTLEIFSDTTAEVQLHVIDNVNDLDDLSDSDRFVQMLAAHLGSILRVDEVKLMHSENVGDMMIFDLV